MRTGTGELEEWSVWRKELVCTGTRRLWEIVREIIEARRNRTGEDLGAVLWGEDDGEVEAVRWAEYLEVFEEAANADESVNEIRVERGRLDRRYMDKVYREAVGKGAMCGSVGIWPGGALTQWRRQEGEFERSIKFKKVGRAKMSRTENRGEQAEAEIWFLGGEEAWGMIDWSVGGRYAVGQLGVEWEEEVQCWMPQKKKERWEVSTSSGQRYVQGKAALLADEIMGRPDPKSVGTVLELGVSADQFMRGEAVEKIQKRFGEAGLRGHRAKAKATVALGQEAIALSPSTHHDN